ncbi:MAG: rubrerythrin family protein, partial [Defluviitoga tunisiensis]
MAKENIKDKLLIFQKNEITEYEIYRKIAKSTKDENNKKVLEKIAQEELNHYNIWKSYTGIDVKPNKVKIDFYVLLSKILGLT